MSCVHAFQILCHRSQWLIEQDRGGEDLYRKLGKRYHLIPTVLRTQGSGRAGPGRAQGGLDKTQQTLKSHL